MKRPGWLKHRRWLWIIGLALAFAALHYAARFPWLVTWNTLADADWGLLAAAGAINLLSLAAKAWAWQLLVRPFGPLTFRTAQAATFAGAAINAIGVAMSGEAGRIHLASSRDGVAAGLADALGRGQPHRRGGGARHLPARGRRGRCLGARLAPPRRGRAAHRRARSRCCAGSRGSGRDAARARPPAGPRYSSRRRSRSTSASWGLQWATYHWSIVATGAKVTPALSVLALVLSNVGGILRLTPGNVGVVQGAVVLGLRPAGIEASRAVAAGVALQAVQVLPVLLIGVGLLGRHGMRELARRRAVEPA